MAVTPNDIAVALGRPTPLDPADEAQIQTWLDRALYLIQRAATLRGIDFATLDPADVDYVIASSVEQYARGWRSDSASRYSVRIDDGQVDRTYTKDAGALGIDDALLAILFPEVAASGAFSVRPTFVADVPDVESWA